MFWRSWGLCVGIAVLAAVSVRADDQTKDEPNLAIPVEVTTFSSQKAKLSVAELERALSVWKARASTNYSKHYLNDDGTVTLVEPRAALYGTSHRLDTRSGPGACALFGMGGFVFHETELTEEAFVVVNAEGSWITGPFPPRPYERLTVLDSITCERPKRDVAVRDARIEVTTEDGEKVEILPEELAKAFEVIARRFNTNFEKLLLNDDGTLALIKPRFRYRGKLYSISSVAPAGACTLFGLEGVVNTHTVKLPSGSEVKLDACGKLEYAPYVFRDHLKVLGIDAISCKRIARH